MLEAPPQGVRLVYGLLMCAEAMLTSVVWRRQWCIRMDAVGRRTDRRGVIDGQAAQCHSRGSSRNFA